MPCLVKVCAAVPGLAVGTPERYRDTMSDLFTDRSQGEPRVDLHAWYAASPLGQRLRQQLTRDMKVILDGWFGFNLVVIGPIRVLPWRK